MVRVMVVDDSPLVRKIATDILESDPGVSVVATASNGEFALRKLEREKPDVITMDIEMPGMGGIATIREIMVNQPTPIVVLSAHARKGAELTFQALDTGACDFVPKPTYSLSGGITDIAKELIEKVKNASKIRVKKLEKAREPEAQESEDEDKYKRKVPRFIGSSGHYDLIAIGTSTGGPVALRNVLCRLPKDFPAGIVVVQHMPPVFTRAFADRLDSLGSISVKEAEDQDVIIAGRALIAPGDFHMTVTRFKTDPKVLLNKREQVSGHRPSVDVLMNSVAREYGERAIGIIMTGMGHDGAAGIKEMRTCGGHIIAQDMESSVIFGMNGEVVKRGNADEVVHVDSIAERIMKHVCGKKSY